MNIETKNGVGSINVHREEGWSSYSFPKKTMNAAILLNEGDQIINGEQTYKSKAHFESGLEGTDLEITGNTLFKGNVVFETAPLLPSYSTNYGDVSQVPNSKGIVQNGNTFNLTVADENNPGLISNSDQTISGLKSFISGVNVSGIVSVLGDVNATNFNGVALSTSTLSGTNTGNVSLTAPSATSNSNGAILSGSSGQSLTLTYADGSNPGILSNTDQIISGNKTFVSNLTVSGLVSASAFSSPNLSGTNTGNVTLLAPSATSNAKGATISGQALSLTYADGANPGILSNTDQIISGNKTFVSNLTVSGVLSASSFSSSSLSGTNTGDVSLTAPSSTSSVNGATLSGQSLTLTYADSSNPGILSTSAQTIAGNKTFVANMAVSGNIAATGNVTGTNISGTNTGNVTLTAPSATSNVNGATLSGQALTLTLADGTNPGLLSATAQTIAGTKSFSSIINATAATGTGLAVTSNATVGGTLTVTGALTAATVNGVTVNNSTLSGTNTGNVSLTAPSATPNSNGATISGQALTLTYADGSNPGILSNTDQIISGNKTFVSNMTVSGNMTATGNVTGTNLSGTNTGNVTLTAPSATSNVNGATLSGQALTLTIADATNPGLLSTVAQTVAGVKSFSSVINATAATGTGLAVTSNATVGGTLSVTGALTAASLNGVTVNTSTLSGTNTGNVSLTAPSATSNSNGAILSGSSGQSLTLTYADISNPGILSNTDQVISGNKTFVSDVNVSGAVFASLFGSGNSTLNNSGLKLPSVGGTSSINTHYEESAPIVFTVSGGSSSSSVTGYYSRNGNIVCLTIPLVGTLTSSGGGNLILTPSTTRFKSKYDTYKTWCGTFNSTPAISTLYVSSTNGSINIQYTNQAGLPNGTAVTLNALDITYAIS